MMLGDSGPDTADSYEYSCQYSGKRPGDDKNTDTIEHGPDSYSCRGKCPGFFGPGFAGAIAAAV